MTTGSSPGAGPLVGVLVADLSTTLPGPYSTQLLRRLGARVIHLEPKSGDPTRLFPAIHAALCAGKESVVVDLSTDSDRELVHAICARADVVVEGWRPGVSDRLGLGHVALQSANPMLVYCSISGYGASGELVARAGHDINYMAAAGMLRTLFGSVPPLSLEVPLADLAGGTFAALRVAASLVEARATGRGSHIDMSLAGAVRDWLEAIGAGLAERPLGPLLDLPHYGLFETSDGELLSLGVVHEDHLWRGLCEAIGRPDLADLGSAARAEQSAALREAIADAVKARPRPWWEHRFAEVDTCWSFVEPASTPAPIGGRTAEPEGRAATLGEHTEAVRAEFDRRTAVN